MRRHFVHVLLGAGFFLGAACLAEPSLRPAPIVSSEATALERGLGSPPPVPAAPSRPSGQNARAKTSTGAPPATAELAAPDLPDEEPLSRPERQWRWIAEASETGCREALAATEADFIALPDDAAPDADGCGIPRGVILKRGVTAVRYSPALRVDCSFALRLGEIERIWSEEAKEHFQTEIARIGHVGTYVCRQVVGRLRGRSGGISEHSFGNAIDVTHLDLKTGRRISVLHHYGATAPALQPYRNLLHDVIGRVRRETGMRGLGPDFDASHRTHFHFDAGSRWWRW